MFNEYACAMDGTGQGEPSDCMANVRVALPTRLGGPKPAGYVPSRVSAMRQGVIPTNTRAPAGVAAFVWLLVASALVAAAICISVWFGCQYNGAGHGRSVTTSYCT